MSQTIVVPGDHLGSESEYDSGAGTYVLNGQINASLLGVKILLPLTAGDDSGKKGTLVVMRRGSQAAIVPEVGGRAIARITRITQLQAYADIIVVNGKAVSQPFSAVIRREQIRDTDIDAIRMEECFLPGDLVQAEVASLGDARSYFLATARPEFGVVHALAENGEVLVPVSAVEMVRPSDGRREKRKVARLDT